jgi:hypothetical protein
VVAEVERENLGESKELLPGAFERDGGDLPGIIVSPTTLDDWRRLMTGGGS